MSYVDINLGIISNGNAPFAQPRLRFGVAQYKHATDTIADMVVADYFKIALYGENAPAGKVNGILTPGDVIMLQEPDGTDIKFVIIYDDSGVAKVREVGAFGFADVVTGASAQTAFVVAIPGLAAGTPVVASIATSSVGATPIIKVDNSVANQVTITLESAYTGDITFSLVVSQ